MFNLTTEDGGHQQTDHRSNETVAHLSGSQQGLGSIASLLGTGADDLLVALVVGGEAGVLDLLRDVSAAPLDPVLVVHVELDHRLAAEGLLAVGRGAIRQILIVPLGTRGVHHQSTAVIVVVRVALVTPDGTGFGRKSKQGGNTLINCTLITSERY